MATVIISLILTAIVVSIIFKLKNDKKRRKASYEPDCTDYRHRKTLRPWF